MNATQKLFRDPVWCYMCDGLHLTADGKQVLSTIMARPGNLVEGKKPVTTTSNCGKSHTNESTNIMVNIVMVLRTKSLNFGKRLNLSILI